MFYFNDVPRFLEVLSDDKVTQDSCLHGGGSISSLITDGNGMYPQFGTNASILTVIHGHAIHDYGACSVQQLLTGVSVYNISSWAEKAMLPENIYTKNACAEDSFYASFIQSYFDQRKPAYDYVLINDNTRNPARNETRLEALDTLKNYHIPWLLETGARPIFMWTHAYIPAVPMSGSLRGLEDVANFTSLTGAGYRAYAHLLEHHLPPHQKPLIAPVGLAFLTVHEENMDMWYQLFHNWDHLHASPRGTFLTGCVLHYTLFGRMPERATAIQSDMSQLWSRARMMQHYWEPPNPMIDETDAEYLYGVAERVMVRGHVPASYIDYQHGEVAYEGGR
jgi:hypothetical protein